MLQRNLSPLGLFFSLLLVVVSCLFSCKEHDQVQPNSPSPALPINRDPLSALAKFPGKKALIVYGNDLESMVDGFATNNSRRVGGLPGRKNFLNDLQKRIDNLNEAHLIVDAGNSLTTHVEIAQEFVAMGLDAMALGKLELIGGITALQRLIETVHLPLLNANVVKGINADQTLFTASKLIERNGLKFGIFGITSASFLTSVKGSLRKMGYEIVDPNKAANRQIDQLRRQGADIIVVLSNMPWLEQIRFADQIDQRHGPVIVIAGGDRHPTPIPAAQNGNIIVETAGLGKTLGVLHFIMPAGAKDFHDASELIGLKILAAQKPTSELDEKIRNMESELQKPEKANQILLFNLVVGIQELPR